MRTHDASGPETRARPFVSEFGVVDPLSQPDWDERVGGFPESTVFHSSGWARSLVESYRFTPRYLVARSDDRWLGVVPLMEAATWLTARRGISLPFTDYCSPLRLPDGPAWPPPSAGLSPTGTPWFQTALQSAQEWGWRTLEVRGWGGYLPMASASAQYYLHTLGLVPDESLLLGGFASSVRRAIRRAAEAGVKVTSEVGAAAIEEYYRLHCLTRHRQGIPPQPRRFFTAIQRHLIEKGTGRVFIARHAGEPIAAAVFLHFGRSVSYKFGASNERFQHLRGNNLVMWEAIRWFAQRGFRSLEFGRTSLANEGLRRFKLGWGAKEVLLPYHRLSLPTQRFVKAPDRSAGWHTRMLRFLPLAFSRWLGSWIYPHAT